jgi:hypothetical protein
LWIGLGTFVQLAGYSDYNYLRFEYGSFIYQFLWWITFPCNILLFILLFSEKLNDIYIYVIILQSVKVLLYWWIFYKTVFQKSRNKSKG